MLAFLRINASCDIDLRDWSLITRRGGGGGYLNGRGLCVKCYPYEKEGGAEKVLVMLKEGHN